MGAAISNSTNLVRNSNTSLCRQGGAIHAIPVSAPPRKRQQAVSSWPRRPSQGRKKFKGPFTVAFCGRVWQPEMRAWRPEGGSWPGARSTDCSPKTLQAWLVTRDAEACDSRQHPLNSRSLVGMPGEKRDTGIDQQRWFSYGFTGKPISQPKAMSLQKWPQ